MRAFDTLEPVGAARADWQAALIAHAIAVGHAGKKAGDVSDYLLRWEERKLPSEHDLEIKMRAAMSRLGSEKK